MKSIVCSQLVTVKYHTFSLTYFHYPAKNKHKYCNMLHILYATLLIFHIFKNYPYFHNHTKNAQRIFKGQPAVNICSGTLNTKNFTYIHKLQLRNIPVVNCEKNYNIFFNPQTSCCNALLVSTNSKDPKLQRERMKKIMHTTSVYV